MTGTLYVSNIQGISKLTAPAKQYLITRAGPDIEGFKRIRVLSPSPQLFHRYLTEWKDIEAPDTWWPKYVAQFEKQFKNELFLAELRKIYKQLLKNNDVLLVCYCKDWHYCHRRLIGDFFAKYGIKVVELSPVKYQEIWLDL